MALTHLEVVEIMRRGDLHRARPFFGIGVVIGDDRDRPPDDRQAHALADQVAIAGVTRMHRDRRITQHGFGPRGGDHDLARAVFQRVGEMPVESVHLPLLNLEVGNCGLEVRVPVHQALVAIDQFLAVEGHEHLGHRPRQTGIEGKALPAPVTRGAGGRRNCREIVPPDLLFHCQTRSDKGLATHVATAHVARRRRGWALDHHLGGDAGVVGSGQPERRRPAHALEADQDVLKRIVERVTDVQRAGHVWGRYDNRK